MQNSVRLWLPPYTPLKLASFKVLESAQILNHLGEQWTRADWLIDWPCFPQHGYRVFSDSRRRNQSSSHGRSLGCPGSLQQEPVFSRHGNIICSRFSSPIAHASFPSCFFTSSAALELDSLFFLRFPVLPAKYGTPGSIPCWWLYWSFGRF